MSLAAQITVVVVWLDTIWLLYWFRDSVNLRKFCTLVDFSITLYWLRFTMICSSYVLHWHISWFTLEWQRLIELAFDYNTWVSQWHVQCVYSLYSLCEKALTLVDLQLLLSAFNILKLEQRYIDSLLTVSVISAWIVVVVAESSIEVNYSRWCSCMAHVRSFLKLTEHKFFTFLLDISFRKV